MSKNTESPAVEFHHVTIAFDDIVALRDVSFTLAQNEMMLVTGASNSGKSVLVRLAMGMLRPDEGQVFVRGHEISAMAEDDILNLRSQLLGMVFQDEALFTALNVYENTAYRLVEHGWSEEKTQQAVHEILSFVGLEKDMEKMVAELSGGMKRRLEFARAFVGWPPIMLFDEPTTGLDPINARAMRDLILRARDLHEMSSLVVTKAMNEIPYLIQHYATRDESGAIVIRAADADRARQTRILVLDKGEIAWLGDYEAFLQSDLRPVTQLLHPQPSAVNPDFHPADPWDKHNQTEHLL